MSDSENVDTTQQDTRNRQAREDKDEIIFISQILSQQIFFIISAVRFLLL